MTATLSFRSNILRAGRLYLDEIGDLADEEVSPRDMATIGRQAVAMIRAATVLEQIRAQQARRDIGTAASVGEWPEYLRLELRVFHLWLCGCVLRSLEIF